jgi:transposase
MQGVHVERLDHLGIVAGICREIGRAEYLDARAGPTQLQVSVGTATVAMILNGLGFSNRRLYLVAQVFATKPVEHLLGAGITADMLHDDCLGRTLDWRYDHDPTALFAGIARQARQRFGISARQVHVDTTSFAVTGEDDAELDAQTIAVTYGYSRDHRADLKQWMLALAATRAGDVPLFCQALDSNTSDKATLVAAVEALADQLRTEDTAAPPIFVADSGLYSVENVARLSLAGVRWISRVPDTSTAARAALEVSDDAWQQDGPLFWATVAQATLARQVEQARQTWEQALWRLGDQRFAGAPTPQRRSPSSSSSLRHGSRCRASSSPIPSRADPDARARTPRPTEPSGRSRPPCWWMRWLSPARCSAKPPFSSPPTCSTRTSWPTRS